VERGLRPPAPSSVEPNGTPTRAGDEADAADPAKELLVVAQVPDASPAMPPPSNVEGDPVSPLDRPVPYEDPVIGPRMPEDMPPEPEDELPIPDDEPPVLDGETPVPDVVTTVPRPYDDSASEPPKPAHPRREPDDGGEYPDDAIGLTPCTGSAVAPRGIRVGGTGDAEPTPSGDDMPSGEVPGATCATAELQAKATTAVAVIMTRVGRIPSLELPCATEVINDSMEWITCTRSGPAPFAARSPPYLNRDLDNVDLERGATGCERSRV
jgi:hypothetical protein